jgi:Prolipoprotein diacylglyceryl transferase
VTFRIGSRRVTAFHACGVVGFLAACALALGLSGNRGLSLPTEVALIATAVAAFFAVVLGTAALTGRETLTYYHHELAVLAAVAAVAALLGGPVLPHLDVTALGLGAFLAFGRVGCTLTGCCHGRRWAHGIVYGQGFVTSGVPPYLCGRRLIPVQLLEALATTIIVVVGATRIPATPGAAFGFYITGYAVVRFWLEMLRGDPVRRYWHRLSEAQWTSLGVAVAMASLALANVVPGRGEHAAAAVFLFLSAALVAVRPPRDILDPRHVREIARILPAPSRSSPAPAETTLGIRLSAGQTDDAVHYTVSRAGDPLTEGEVQELASVIGWLARVAAPPLAIHGIAGTVHLVSEDRAVA